MFKIKKKRDKKRSDTPAGYVKVKRTGNLRGQFKVVNGQFYRKIERSEKAPILSDGLTNHERVVRQREARNPNYAKRRKEILNEED